MKKKEVGASQIGLPYAEINSNASRDVVRSLTNNGRGGRETYMFDFSILKIREGFNIRTEYGDINELALFMLKNGMDGMDPFTVDVLPDGTVFVEQGHRRLKAMQLLHSQGELYKIDKPGMRLGKIEAFVNNSEVGELTRLRRQWSSNKSKEYTTLEKAELCKRLKEYFGMTTKEIAAEFGITRQHVDNYLTLANESDDVKQAVKGGNISMTGAVELAKHVKDSTQRNEIVQDAVASGNKLSVSDAKHIQGEGRSDRDNTDRVPRSQKNENGPVYDESREEIKECQNVIKLLDQIATAVKKVGNEQLAKDIDQKIEWAHKSMANVRDWVHKNKKQNKRGS